MIEAVLLAAALSAPTAEPCKNRLAQTIHAAGFRGDDAREAWAIAMRESRGKPRVVSSTNDFGLFQLNYAAHHRQPWWDSERLLTPAYNAKVAYKLSDGGRTWYPWDISGRGEHLGRYTSGETYRVYTYWYARYPKACR